MYIIYRGIFRNHVGGGWGGSPYLEYFTSHLPSRLWKGLLWKNKPYFPLFLRLSSLFFPNAFQILFPSPPPTEYAPDGIYNKKNTKFEQRKKGGMRRDEFFIVWSRTETELVNYSAPSAVCGKQENEWMDKYFLAESRM